MLRVDSKGLHCAQGDFYVDPWRPVDTAIITHAHADHARAGSATYYCTTASERILRHRLGQNTDIRAIPYGVSWQLGQVRLSLHPAGHVLGSAQVRLDNGKNIWVVSGDYKRDADPTCTPFEVVPCDVFITEATFGYPVYRWESGSVIAKQILSWVALCRERGRAAVLLCYALGKAQRILAELDALTKQKAWLHGAMDPLVKIYREAGATLLPTLPVSEAPKDQNWAGELVLAPPSASATPWMKRFGAYELGFASGWMQIRGARRRRSVDRGFVLSDHADWPSLVRTVTETGASKVLVTHGASDVLVRFLKEQGIDAEPLKTAFEGEGDM